MPQSMIGVVAALMLQLVVGVATVTPPTEFDLAKAEGDSFVATLRAALDKLSPSWMTLPQRRVVHLLGASEAEDLVDWSSLCKMANPPSLVFIGPQVVERQTGSCVHTLNVLYSHDKVHKAVPDMSTPDLILIYNADLTRAHGGPRSLSFCRVAVSSCSQRIVSTRAR